MMEVGTEVQLSTVDGQFRGIVLALNRPQGFLTLRNIVDVSADQRLLQPTRNFSLCDIYKCEVMKMNKETGEIVTRRNKFASGLLMDLCLKETSSRAPAICIDSLATANVLSDHGAAFASAAVNGDAAKSSASSPEGASCAAAEEHSVVLVQKIDDTFKAALTDIWSHTVIGVAAEGAHLGRDGIMSLLMMSTAECTYVFDILTLHHKAFRAGLRDILESKAVQKVVFNCRCLSDILWHQYTVALNHVFDCQVAVVMLYRMQNEGRMPQYVAYLPISIVHHLHVHESELFFPRVRVHAKSQDEIVWCRRPTTERMIDAAAKNVKFLCRLRVVLIEEMIAGMGLYDGISYYLDGLKDLSDEEYDAVKYEDKLSIPRELAWKMEQCRFRRGRRPTDDTSMFTDNSGRIARDPRLRISHDGISHATVEKTASGAFYAS